MLGLCHLGNRLLLRIVLSERSHGLCAAKAEHAPTRRQVLTQTLWLALWAHREEGIFDL